jgi:hypothetical protein
VALAFALSPPIRGMSGPKETKQTWLGRYRVYFFGTLTLVRMQFSLTTKVISPTPVVKDGLADKTKPASESRRCTQPWHEIPRGYPHRTTRRGSHRKAPTSAQTDAVGYLE